MTYTKVKPDHPSAMRLQSVGWVLGTPSREIKAGDVLMWNFGSCYTVKAITRITDKFIEILTADIQNPAKEYRQQLKKTRLVCILKPEL